MVEELEFECKEVANLLKKAKKFEEEFDRLPDEIAFPKAKALREEVGKFLDENKDLIDNEYLKYVGYPRYSKSLKELGFSQMEFLLDYWKNLCEGKYVTLIGFLKSKGLLEK